MEEYSADKEKLSEREVMTIRLEPFEEVVLVAQPCPTIQPYRRVVFHWTAVCQAPLSVKFSRQEYWSGLPCISPEDLFHPGIERGFPALQADSLPSELPGKPLEGVSRDELQHKAMGWLR